MSMTISYHPSDFFSFRSCPTRSIIQRIVIILCIIYLSYCQLVQSKFFINSAKIENTTVDPMVFDTRQRLTSTNQHMIVNTTSNKPRLCHFDLPPINSKFTSSTIKPKHKLANISKSYNELTSSISLVSTISKLSSSSSISSSSLVTPNKSPINYDQNISNGPSNLVYLNSSNGLISTISPNQLTDNQVNPPTTRPHHRRHERHRNQLQQLHQLNQEQQSKCHPIKVHRSKTIYLKPSCTKNYVHITGKTVRANESRHAIDNVFHLTAMTIRGPKAAGHLVNFKGIATGKFICFNKKGKIVAKDNGQWDISCLFREISYYSIGYKYQSFYNDNWFLGFDHKGRPIRGTIKRHERKWNGSKRRHIAKHCYEFSKKRITIS